MRLYPRKGKDADGAIWIDNHPREIRFSFDQYKTLCEALNRYVSDQEVSPPKPEVRKLESYIVSAWKVQDREKSLRPE